VQFTALRRKLTFKYKFRESPKRGCISALGGGVDQLALFFGHLVIGNRIAGSIQGVAGR
jgi:hypothetical protein